MLPKKHFFPFALILFFAGPLWGQKSDFIKENIKISERIDKYATDLDEYLAGEKYTKKANKTKLILRNEFDSSKYGEDFKYTFNVDARVDLPNLEEKWELRFTSYDEDEEETGINKNRIYGGGREENYGASLIFSKKLSDYDFRFKPRLRLDNGIQLSHTLEFTRKVRLDKLHVEQRLELFGHYDDGTGELFALNFFYNLMPSVLVGFTNEEEYVDHESVFSTNHSLFINKSIGDSMDLRLGNIYESDNQPHFRLQKFTYYISFSHALYRNVIHYSLTPRLEFPREENFKGGEGVLLDINVIF